MSRWLLIAGCLAGAAAGASADTETRADSNDPARAAAVGYAEAWGPPTGSRLPMLAAQDQDGTGRDLEDLVGRQGLLLFLYRSADW